jgi:FtsJ-like methyltransferase
MRVHWSTSSSSSNSTTAATTTTTNQENPNQIIPVSRAYYKLYEVWYDYLYPYERSVMEQIWNHSNSNDPQEQQQPHGATTTTAMDVGAAPGGWTQVLLHHMSVSNVVAIDAATLPMHRMFVRPNTTTKQRHCIYHIPTTLEHLNLSSYIRAHHHQKLDENNNETTSRTHHPTTTTSTSQMEGLPTTYSLLVCDASVQWNLLLPLIIQQLQQPQNRVTWTVPAVVILTMKLPFKTLPSIQRHVADLQVQIPKFVQQLQAIMYNHHHHHHPTTTTTTSSSNNDPLLSISSSDTTVSSRYRVIHLMANSDSERTLIVIFEKRTTK